MFDDLFGFIVEGIVALFTTLFEGLMALFEWLGDAFTYVIEAIASLFMEDAAAVGVGAILVVFLLLFIEVIAWFFLWLFELIMMLVERRKAKKVPKPVMWRPQPKEDV